MKLKPLGDRIVVKAAPHEEKTKGGLVLPETVKEKPVEGIVVAVGEGKVLENGKRQPMGLHGMTHHGLSRGRAADIPGADE